MNRRTDRQGDPYIPQNFVCGGGGYKTVLEMGVKSHDQGHEIKRKKMIGV